MPVTKKKQIAMVRRKCRFAIHQALAPASGLGGKAL
jgi:hypothetical protein